MIDEKKYRIVIISMVAILLMFGIFVGFNMGNKNNLANTAEAVINKEDDDVNIYESVNTSVKKTDIEVVYEEFYKLCGETIMTNEMIYSTTLEELKEQEERKQKLSSKDYIIKEESKDRIVYYCELDQNCPNHFNVKLEDGVIVIYSIVNESVSTVYNKIDISQDLIRPELIEELNVGIKLNSKEELNLLIEDIES